MKYTRTEEQIPNLEEHFPRSLHILASRLHSASYTLSFTCDLHIQENAETIVLYKKEVGLGFSLLGQHDGKRIVHVSISVVTEFLLNL